MNLVVAAGGFMVQRLGHDDFMPPRRRDGPGDPLLAIGCREAIPIASGGSSVVYRARQDGFDRVVAVKILTLPVIDERARRRFERELALAGRLTGHPNAVTVFASGFLADGRGYVLMEYCPGGSLADRLRTEGALPVRDVVSIGVKMCGVLDLAARQGVVHRDVKPANILVTRFGEPALSDFGVAVVLGETTGTTQALTPVHAAPEVLESRPVGPPADQWSLASTLYTLLAGRAPYAGAEGEGLLTGMLRILSNPVPAIPRRDVPEPLREVLVRAMAKGPDDRWPTAAEMGRALQSVEQDAAWPVTPLPIEEVPDAREGAPLDPSAATGEVTTPGLRQGIRPERISHPLNAGPPPPAVDAASAVDGPGDLPVTPLPTSDEETRIWARRRVPSTPPEAPTETPHRRWWWWWAALGAGLVVVGVVVGLVTSSGSSGPRVNPTTPRLQTPSASLAARLAPRQVEIISEQPTTVTIRWVDPSNGRFPFVVKVSNGALQTAASHTQTVVGGLDPTKGYCFVVGAVYGVGGQVANAPPVCVRGGTT
jgi:serine/threonine-protein kinase PknK